jgi:hypothetical protein
MIALPSETVVIEASSRERLLEHFAGYFKHLAARQIQHR